MTKMALQELFYLVAVFAFGAHAIPSVAFPLNSQVPPVARTNQLFSYTFSSSTFFSNFPISYTLSIGPSWLSLDGPSRTLSGTPSSADVPAGGVTGIPISITATDSTGSTYMNATLVISKFDGPTVNIPPSRQLPAFGTFSAPATLLYHPSTPFQIQFDRQTFSGPAYHYYAVSLDNTPLPSWVNFDGSVLTLSGQTPDYASLIQPPQTFGVRLIASDIEGFAGTSISFDIEVGVHLLVINGANLTIETTPGGSVGFGGLAQAIEIDGRQAKTSELVSVTVNTPEWLSFNNQTLVFSGTAPQSATSTNITINVVDIYEDVANITISLEITSTAIFRTDIKDLNITKGGDFKYDLSLYLYNPTDVDLTVQVDPTESWISFDITTFILAGNVPSNAQTGKISVSVNATSKTSSAQASQAFDLLIAAGSTKLTTVGSATASGTAQSTFSSPKSTESGTSPPVAAGSTSNRAVILAITIPLCLLFLCMLLVLCCCIRRRRKHDEEQSKPISKSDISLPRDEDVESVIEIIPVVRAPTPEPLQLDTSGFMLSTNPGIALGEPQRSPLQSHPPTITKSQTVSALPDNRFSRVLRESDFAANRGRSFSDNALRKTENSWSTTQDSSSSTILSLRRTSSHRVSRTYSNYSRKGHARRSARVLSTRDLKALQTTFDRHNSIRDSIKPIPTFHHSESILNLQDSNFSFLPIDNFSALSSHATFARISNPDDPKSASQPKGERASRAYSTRRHSRFLPNFSIPATGLGHGGRDSISPLSSVIDATNRGSVGHGQSAPSFLSRDSRTWRTMGTRESGSSASGKDNRESVATHYTRYPPDTPGLPLLNRYSNVYTTNQRMSIRVVPKSSSDASNIYSGNENNPDKTSSSLSSSSRNSRPVSRRVGSSPFFAGNSLRSNNGRKSSLNTGGWKRHTVRTSYADSPTVPEEVSTLPPMATGLSMSKPTTPGLEESIMHGLRSVSDEAHQLNPRDSFGISYGLAREGTRQLRSYIEGRMTRESLGSFDSRDSRFESADPSMMNLSQHAAAVNRSAALSPLETPPARGKLYSRHAGGGDDDFEGGSSWETLHTPPQLSISDSRGELSEYEDVKYDATGDGITTARIVERGRASLVSSTSNSGGRKKRESRLFLGGGVMSTSSRDKGSPDVRLIPGKARRPVSVEIDTLIDRKRSSKGTIEGLTLRGGDEAGSEGEKENREGGKGKEKDYKAYI